MQPESQRVYESKRVVLITGAQSNWYEQAIFIVRKDKPRPGVDVVAEAERIIQAYLNETPDAPPKPAAPPRKKAGKGFGLFLNGVTLLCFIAIVCMVGYRYFF